MFATNYRTLEEEIVVYAIKLMETIDMTNLTLKDIEAMVIAKFPRVDSETFNRAFNNQLL